MSLLAMLVAQTASAKIESFFSPSPVVKQTIVGTLEAATATIDIAMYSFSDVQIMAVVKQAATNGIQVRLILNKANQERLKAQDLEDAGVDVRYVTPVMHHKFAIIDGPVADVAAAATATLLTGSGNWSSSSSAKYDEDLLVFNDESKIVLAFQGEFNHLWANAREFGNGWDYDTTSVESGASDWALFTSSNMTAYLYAGLPTFKPAVDWEDGVAGAAIIDEIDLAESTIKIATAHFRRADIYEALVLAMGRGVSVEIVLDQQEFHSVRSDEDHTYFDELLSERGAEVRYKIYSRFWDYRTAKQMHTKYMLVDEKMVVTGSFNWSRNAETNVMENLVRISDAELSRSYLLNFQSIWNYGVDTFSGLLEEVGQAAGHGPCFFDPVSISGKDFLKLRDAFASDACR